MLRAHLPQLSSAGALIVAAASLAAYPASATCGPECQACQQQCQAGFDVCRRNCGSNGSNSCLGSCSQGHAGCINRCENRSSLPAQIRVAQTSSRALLLLCTSKDQSTHANLRIDLVTRRLDAYYLGQKSTYIATITYDFIDYGANGWRNRIDRASGDYFIWNPRGGLVGEGTCRKADGMAISD
jgi:hypothetical protein